MSEENISEALRHVSFLHGLADEHLEELAKAAKFVDFAEGETIFREGEVASLMFLIVSGKVGLEICAPGVGCRRILTVGEGELLGWSPLLEQTRLTATARTLTPIRAIQLSGVQMLALCEHNPRFGYELMRRTALALAKRLNETRMQLVNVFGAEMPAARKDD